MNKACKTCGLVLPLDSFPIGKGNVGGRRPSCKKCYSAYTYKISVPETRARASAKYYRTEKGKEKSKEAAIRNQASRNIQTKAWRERMKAEGKTADLNRKYTYGITPEQYKEMCVVDPVCAICGDADRPLVVDHDHRTEKVRGRLCGTCNSAIGMLGDTPELVNRAVQYLEARC